MNKTEMIAAVITETGLSRKDVTSVVNAIFDGNYGVVATALQRGEEVALQGFGAFRIAVRPPRVARDPRTWAAIAVPSRKAPRFSAGKLLKDTVNR